MKWIALLVALPILAGCEVKLPEKHDRADPAIPAGFPKPGNYEVETQRDVRGSNDPTTSSRETSKRCIPPDEMIDLAQLFVGKQTDSHCHDVVASAEPGQFSVRALCDAPDGDINNIPTETHGSYSADAFEIVSELSLMGMTQRESRAYRRIGDC